MREVKDYFFTSDGTHNGDTVVMRFTDGSYTEGFMDVKPVTEDDIYVFELKEQERKRKAEERAKAKAEKIRVQFQEFLDENISYRELAKMYFELKNRVKVVDATKS